MSGNRSQDAPIGCYKMIQPTCGRAVPVYPLRVYSEILMMRIALGHHNANVSHPLTQYGSQQHTGERIESTCVQVCVNTLWRA